VTNAATVTGDTTGMKSIIEENTREQRTISTNYEVSKGLSWQLPSSTAQIWGGEHDQKAVATADKGVTHVLGEPTETFTVTLPLDDGDHEQLNGTDVIKRNLALE